MTEKILITGFALVALVREHVFYNKRDYIGELSDENVHWTSKYALDLSRDALLALWGEVEFNRVLEQCQIKYRDVNYSNLDEMHLPRPLDAWRYDEDAQQIAPADPS